MRNIIVALLAMVALPATAADLAAQTKAPAAPIACTVTGCSGWYIGGGIEGAGPIASGQADLTSGAGIGGHIGYQLWNGSWFAALEVGATGYFGVSTFTPSSGVTATAGQWSADYLAKAGYGLGSLFNTGTTATPSQGLFANLNASLISPYVVVGGRTRQFGTGFVSGAGLEYTIGNGWNAYAEYLHVNYNDTISGTNISVGTENVVRAGVNRMF